MSGQEGAVEQGQPPVIGMDLDLALRVLEALERAHGMDPQGATRARDALRLLVDRARQYVAGPTSGRLAALCQVLQESVPAAAAPVNAETVAQAWLTERGLIVITRELAARLGVFPS